MPPNSISGTRGKFQWVWTDTYPKILKIWCAACQATMTARFVSREDVQETAAVAMTSHKCKPKPARGPDRA